MWNSWGDRLSKKERREWNGICAMRVNMKNYVAQRHASMNSSGIHGMRLVFQNPEFMPDCGNHCGGPIIFTTPKSFRHLLKSGFTSSSFTWWDLLGTCFYYNFISTYSGLLPDEQSMTIETHCLFITRCILIWPFLFLKCFSNTSCKTAPV